MANIDLNRISVCINCRIKIAAAAGGVRKAVQPAGVAGVTRDMA